MKNIDFYKASGKSVLPNIPVNTKVHDPELYLPSIDLQNAVNVALALGMPLLLTGEPGTGKTELASHIAWQFDLNGGVPLVFNAQTTSTVKDLFYRYDALSHFQFTQTQKQVLTPEEIEQRFIRYQALGDAIRHNRRAVVLLDEIDKAPRDLPNDLLAALENLQFDVPEIEKTYKATPDNRPIVILTSNSEKNLPVAFLRRVVYYHIRFPEPESLLRIVSAKIDGFSGAALDALIDHFLLIRKQAKLRKNPATAELIQWAFLLKRLEFPAQKLDNLDTLSNSEKETLKFSYPVLAKNKEDLTILIGRV